MVENADEMKQKLVELMKSQRISLGDVVLALKIKHERELEMKVAAKNEAKSSFNVQPVFYNMYN